MVAYPSLGEGFGLPVLEAMACGAAVLTTRKLSLPEVGGDAVAYTGTGAGDIAAALSDLLDHPEQRGPSWRRPRVERAAAFTWAASAAAHQEAYDRAAAAARGMTARPAPAGRIGRPSPTRPAIHWPRCSTRSRRATAGRCTVVLADNGSTDGSVEAAAARPGVRLLRTGGNLGYGARGQRRGRRARSGDRLGDGDQPRRRARRRRDRRAARGGRRGTRTAGAFGPLITTPDGVVYPSARHLPSIGAGRRARAVRLVVADEPVDQAVPAGRGEPVERTAGWLSGSCLLLRREAFARGRRLRPGVLHVLRGRRPRRPAGRGRLVERLLPVRAGGAPGWALHRTGAGRDGRTRTTAAPTATCPGGTRRRWQAPLRLALRVGLAGRAFLSKRSARMAGGRLPARSARRRLKSSRLWNCRPALSGRIRRRPELSRWVAGRHRRSAVR